MAADILNYNPPPTRNGGTGQVAATRGPPDHHQATGGAAINAAAGRSDTLSINFCNIRGLCSNFQSVEHHLAVSSPDLLLLSETQLSSNASPDLYLASNYNFYPKFRFKGGVCAPAI